MVTVIALLVAVPLGLGAAMYLSEYASRRARKYLKPTVELLAGVPSVVYGFFALTFVTPTLLQDILNMDVGFTNALAAGLVLGVMIIPTVASLAEDAMSAVPQALRQGSLAMGANRMQTTLRVVFPAALSGIAAAVVLGLSRAVGETMIVALAAGRSEEPQRRPARGHADHDGLHRPDRRRRDPGRVHRVQHPLRRRPAAVHHHAGDQHHQHRVRPSIQAGVLMSLATPTRPRARSPRAIATTGRSKDRNNKSLIFLGLLWFSLFFGVMVLLVLIVDTAIEGSGSLRPRADHQLRLHRSAPRPPASVPASSAPLWLMFFTALLAVPLGIAAALYLEEFANKDRWYNRLIEVNLQNLAAVPSIVYGLLAVAVMALLGFQQTGIVLGGAIALALLILPGHHHHHPRGRARGADRHPARLAGPGRHHVADDLAPDAALGRSRHRDRARSSACPGPSARRPRSSWSGSPAPCASTPRAC